MSTLDYSKWDHIEISDDEDETHPNVDTPSLFRWRHQARLEKMQEREQEWASLEKEKEQQKQKLKDLEKKLRKQKLSKREKKNMAVTKEELLKQEEEFKKKEKELSLKDKQTPWNVDTICKEGFSKSIINKKKEDANAAKSLSDDEKFEEQRAFHDKYRKEICHYGMISKPSESRRYLEENPYLISEKVANFLVIWCIDLEVEDKTNLMERVAHQTIVLQFILQLGSTMQTDPRNCFPAFFKRFENPKADYLESFHEELSAFIVRVKERARVRIEEAVKKYEEELREKEMGPGGLHPTDVMETLPAEMQECFEKKDIPMLRKVINGMDRDQARYHMKRCVAAGLWLPEGGKTFDGPEDDVRESI